MVFLWVTGLLLGLFGQTIIDLAIKHGIDTPVTKNGYKELQKSDQEYCTGVHLE